MNIELGFRPLSIIFFVKIQVQFREQVSRWTVVNPLWIMLRHIHASTLLGISLVIQFKILAPCNDCNRGDGNEVPLVSLGRKGGAGE